MWIGERGNRRRRKLLPRAGEKREWGRWGSRLERREMTALWNLGGRDGGDSGGVKWRVKKGLGEKE